MTETMTLADYVANHTERGECRCGKCLDRGDAPDPEGHTADMVFFRVARRGEPTREDFIRLTRGHRGAFGEYDPLDGKGHTYIELGGWMGDQGLALLYMALGALLGVFSLATPRTLFPGIGDAEAMQMAGSGLVMVLHRAEGDADASAL